MRKPTIEGFPHTLVGYMRVSLDGDRQTTAPQRDALLAAGVDDRHLYEDKASGARADRPGLERALAFARSGDCLIVWKLDRLGCYAFTLPDTVARGELRPLRDPRANDGEPDEPVSAV